ncbi:hypothetical protein TL16_g04362 [Triparma laevis f. inornata]|uniref:Protein FAM33A n=1 Tax=Triparma laevis f. inornata TaxID=1714386 RepID=A0A9W7E4T2_9STRA|nr:hypothetical protein TL16_g04362 [Triparma laevis f. inornata]
MEAADALSSALSKVATNLSTIQHAFSSDFKNFEKSGDVPNPEKLLLRLKSLEQKITTLSTTASNLISNRQPLIQSTSSALLSNYLTLNYLSTRANYKPETLNNPFAEQASGTVELINRESISVELASQLKLVQADEVNPIVNKVLSLSDSTNVPLSESTTQPSTLLPFTVSQSEFTSLPTSIRGRSQLQSLNSLLTHLTSLHNAASMLKTSNVSQFWSVKDLEGKGFKVTGKTGGDVLRGLEKLGRVEVCKREGVRLCV